ncbi:hypothetical protein [Gordonia sp. NPDC003376]
MVELSPVISSLLADLAVAKVSDHILDDEDLVTLVSATGPHPVTLITAITTHRVLGVQPYALDSRKQVRICAEGEQITSTGRHLP